MNIDDMTIGEARQLAKMFSNANIEPSIGGPQFEHPLLGHRVIAVLPHGFVYIGILSPTPTGYQLSEASNIRYWTKRDGGLPELARNGSKDDDRIDPIGDAVYFDNYLFFYPCGEWND